MLYQQSSNHKDTSKINMKFNIKAGKQDTIKFEQFISACEIHHIRK